MKSFRTMFHVLATSSALALIALAIPARAYAHCDTMDGPVVRAAQRALDTKKAEPVLIWVRAQDESEIRRAFAQTLAVRGLGKPAAELADRYFFETVVRLHRTGEGEPYTGLKPAGTDLGHAVPAADRALASGSVAELHHVLAEALDARLIEYFGDAAKKRSFAPDDVVAGRRYVEAYVRLLHFAEEMEVLTAGRAHAPGAVGRPAAQPR